MFCRELSCAGLNQLLESVQNLTALIQGTPWDTFAVAWGVIESSAF